MKKIEVPTFLKWAGGKKQLLNQFSDKFPKKIEYYVEPFLGGGAVLFYILKYKQPKSVRVYDINDELVNTYLQVKNNIKKLIDELSSLENEHNGSENPNDYYYKKRGLFNHYITNRKNPNKNFVKKAALLIYLNKTCFNGLFRVNSIGEFNVPFNRRKNVNIFDEEKLKEASDLLNKGKVVIEKKNFEDVKFYKYEFVYLDPPYWSDQEKKGFTSYSNNAFDEESQRTLGKMFLSLHNKGNKIVLSNSDTKLIHQIYSDKHFVKHNIVVRRMINCNGEGRNKINELLVTSNFKTEVQHQAIG